MAFDSLGVGVVHGKVTWVWMRLRPRNQRIWPRRSSRSAWSISSMSSSSSSSSSGISSFWVPWPAVFKNFKRLVGTEEITWKTSGFTWAALTYDNATLGVVKWHFIKAEQATFLGTSRTLSSQWTWKWATLTKVRLFDVIRFTQSLRAHPSEVTRFKYQNGVTTSCCWRCCT